MVRRAVVLLFVVSCLLSFKVHAYLPDFECPDGFVCPKEIMPEVEFWVMRYGKLSKSEMIVYDNKYKNIYSYYQCQGECEKDPNRLTERTRVEKLLLSVAQKMQSYQTDDLTPDEQTIYHSIQTIPDFNLVTTEYNRHLQRNVSIRAEDRLVYSYGHRETFLEGLPIYKEYRQHIVESLKKNGFPLAIQYLPFAESGYNPFITSGAGAVGLWQLMPAVGTKHGLVVQRLKKNRQGKYIYPAIDERRDPIKATDAAMKYFEEAYRCLGGIACEKDFDPSDPALGPLIMTSYIYGISGTEKAIENQGVDYLQIRNQHKDKNFGPYTKGYYPKFLGVMYVATHEEEFFGKIVDSANKGDTKLLKLRIKAKPQLFTQKIPFSIQELKMLPWNMRYTDYVWSGRQFIPMGEPFELPYFADNSIFANLGTVIDFPKYQN